MNEKWFAMSVEEIEKKLKTNAALGLSQKAAASRCQEKKTPFFSVKKRSWNRLLLDLVSDFFLVMLLLVAFFSLFFEGDYIIGSAALVLTFINLGVTFFFYYRDTKAVESTSDFFSPTALNTPFITIFLINRGIIFTISDFSSFTLVVILALMRLAVSSAPIWW